MNVESPTIPDAAHARAQEPQVEMVDRAELKVYERNARTHSPDQVRQIAASIEEFGWTNPLLIDGDRNVIAGHGRLLAAELVGLDRVPCIVLGHLSEAQQRALVLADNQLALNAGWDMDLLRTELVGLEGLGFDLELLGFTDFDLVSFMSTPKTSDPEETPALQEVVVSAPGDVWLLGEHRIICGDSTDPETVKALLGEDKPHLMVTDPPYGVEYDPSWRADGGLNKRTAAQGKVLNDDRADWTAAWALFPGDVAYVWHGGLHSGEVQASLEAAGFVMRAQIVWNKTSLIIGRGDYHWKHEPCWYAVRKGKTGHWAGDRKQSTVWDIEHRRSETGHGTQKPVEAMRRPIVNNSKPGQLVYEPFSGSGTTIIACEQENRKCRAVELNPAYVDLAVRRWQTFAGQVATHATTGAPFPADDPAA